MSTLRRLRWKRLRSVKLGRTTWTIIDIKLRDVDGTDLLARVHEILPRARKIMITGYPSLENAVDSVNLQADAYIIKPVNPDNFLKVVAENMDKQLEGEQMTEQKVVGRVESRYRGDPTEQE